MVSGEIFQIQPEGGGLYLRKIATYTAPDDASSWDIATNAWEACNVRPKRNEFGIPEEIVFGGISVRPTKNFRGSCGSDVFVSLYGRRYAVADFIGWSRTYSVDAAVEHICDGNKHQWGENPQVIYEF